MIARLLGADVLGDIRYSVRTLRGSPALAVTAIATLAIGLGLNATVFAITNAVLFTGFVSLPSNDEILYIGTQKDGRGCCVSYPDYLDWRAAATSFTDLAAVADLRVALADGDRSDTYIATEVTPNAFTLLDVTPALGRDFAESDGEPGAAPVAILSHRVWTERFLSDRSILGRTVRVNGMPTTIVGVMPEGFRFPQNQELWLPLAATRARMDRSNRMLWFAFGRLRDGATFETAHSELERIGSNLARTYAATNAGWLPAPRRFAEFFISNSAPTAYLTLWAAVALVLMIACANLANLMLARSLGRAREFAVRCALGASRWRLIRQTITEGVLLSAAGGVLALWIAQLAIREYAQWANPPGRLWSEHLIAYVIDGRVLLYLVIVSIAAGLFMGLLPALRFTSFNGNAGLTESGGRGATGSRRTRGVRAALVIAEMALAVVLLCGSTVMFRSFIQQSRVDLGVNPSNTLAMLLSLPSERYSDRVAQVMFFDQMMERIRSMPGIEGVSLASALPTGNAQLVAYEGRMPEPTQAEQPTVATLTIAPDYFKTLGVPLRAGRDFTNADRQAGRAVVIVNEAFAATEWPGQDAIGQRLWFDRTKSEGAATVVGVAPNILQNDAFRRRQQFEPLVYLPYRQRPASNMWVLARAAANPSSVAARFRREAQMVDPDLAVWLGPLTVEQHLAGYGNYWISGMATVLFVVFAVVGVSLAAIGLYGVMAHLVGERTKEIGIRMAIGGSARNVLILVLTQATWQVTAGIALGLSAAAALTSFLRSYFVNVSGADITAMFVASLTLVLVAALACVAPTLRATRVDPIVALRSE